MPTIPVNTATSIRSIGRGAFTGLGGYMTLGLTTKAKPIVENIGNDQVLIPKDSTYKYREAKIILMNTLLQMVRYLLA